MFFFHYFPNCFTNFKLQLFLQTIEETTVFEILNVKAICLKAKPVARYLRKNKIKKIINNLK